MDSKIILIAAICLIGGLVGGYLIASTTLQNEVAAYQLRTQSQDAEITAKDALIQAKDTQLQAEDTEIQAKNAQLQVQATQLQEQSTLIQSQEGILQQLKANVTRLQELIQAIGGQAQTQVRIDSVTWESSSFTLDVRNTGSVDAVLASVSIRVNQAGSAVTVLSSSVISRTIPYGGHTLVGPVGYAWTSSTSYVIRATTNTGFYYEAVFTSPAS
jgi:hypothetical protein